MIRTWVASVIPLYKEECYRAYYERAPVFRREKADRYRGRQMRAQSLGAWMLYEWMKKTYQPAEDAEYNLSHSGEYVLCSVSMDAPPRKILLGCDIEREREAVNLRMAERFFCPSESRQIKEETREDARRDLFGRYWVLKESFLKATRKGMALGMNTFEILLGDPPVLLRQPEAFPEKYYYREERIKGESGIYHIAVCSTDDEIDAVRQVKFGDEKEIIRRWG